MAQETFVARESGASPLNAEGKAQRGKNLVQYLGGVETAPSGGATKEINDSLWDLTRKYADSEGKDLERMYRLYGDVETAELQEDGELQVYFVTKAYGNEGRTRGTIPIMSDEEYKKAAPREFYNPFRDETTYTSTSREYAANSLVRFIRKKGGKVKRITYVEDKD